MILVLLLITIVSLILIPFFNVIAKELDVAQTRIDKEEALQIAEAGANYYQWHLALFPTDYEDGTGTSGPYVHAFTDLTTQQVIGYYSLTITPPAVGATVVTIQSTGWTTDTPAVTRTVTAKYGSSVARGLFVLEQRPDMDRERRDRERPDAIEQRRPFRWHDQRAGHVCGIHLHLFFLARFAMPNDRERRVGKRIK